MRFPWMPFVSLGLMCVMGAVIVVLLAWWDASSGGSGTSQNIPQALHQYAWNGGPINLLMYTFFFSMGWLHHRGLAEDLTSSDWFQNHRVACAVLLLLPLIPVGVLWEAHYDLQVDWQFWPADLYYLVVLYANLGFSGGSWLQERLGKQA